MPARDRRATHADGPGQRWSGGAGEAGGALPGRSRPVQRPVLDRRVRRRTSRGRGSGGLRAASPPPLPAGGHHHGTGQRAEDAAGPELEPVPCEETDRQTTDERPGQPRDEGHRPVEVAGRTAEQQLGAGPDDHAEQDDAEE